MENGAKREKRTSVLYGWLYSTVGSVLNYFGLKNSSANNDAIGDDAFVERVPMPGAWPASPVVSPLSDPSTRAAGRQILSPRSRLSRSSLPKIDDAADTQISVRGAFSKADWNQFYAEQNWNAVRTGADRPNRAFAFGTPSKYRGRKWTGTMKPTFTSPVMKYTAPIMKRRLASPLKPTFTTPVMKRRAASPVKSSYRLGFNRPATSILKNSRPNFARIEPATPDQNAKTTAVTPLPNRQTYNKKSVYWKGHKQLPPGLKALTTDIYPKKEIPFERDQQRLFDKEEPPTVKTPGGFAEWRSPEKFDADTSVLSPPSKADECLNLSPEKTDAEHGPEPNLIEISDIVDYWMRGNEEVTSTYDLELSNSARKMIHDRESLERQKKREEDRVARLKLANHQRKLSDERKAKEAAEQERIHHELLAVAAERAKKHAEEQNLRKAWDWEIAQLEREESIKVQLSAEWEQKVDTAMATMNRQEVLVSRNSLTRHDFGTLLPQRGRDSSSAWLNDQIVNTSMDLMVARMNTEFGHDAKSKTDPAPHWAFNSAWLNTLSGGRVGGDEDVLDDVLKQGLPKFSRWAKKRGVNLGGQNLLQARSIYFPICHNSHWTMLVVYPGNKQIEYLDSFNHKGHGYTDIVRKWLAFELGETYVEEEWQVCTGRSPRQDNAQDCGVFAIMNAFARMRNGCPRSQFTQDDIPGLRRQIAATLLNGGFTEEFDFAAQSHILLRKSRIEHLERKYPHISKIEPDNIDKIIQNLEPQYEEMESIEWNRTMEVDELN
jgi:hypothetical protein